MKVSSLRSRFIKITIYGLCKWQNFYFVAFFSTLQQLSTKRNCNVNIFYSLLSHYIQINSLVFINIEIVLYVLTCQILSQIAIKKPQILISNVNIGKSWHHKNDSKLRVSNAISFRELVLTCTSHLSLSNFRYIIFLITTLSKSNFNLNF